MMCFTTRIQSYLGPQSPTFGTSNTLHLPTIHLSFGCDDADGAMTCWWCQWSLWLCLLLLPLVCFLSHYATSGVFHQTGYNNRIGHNHHRSILQSAVSYPHFPSLPTSFRVELLPIHVSFGCDTIWLVIGYWLCFSGVVRGPLLLDSSWYPQSSS